MRRVITLLFDNGRSWRRRITLLLTLGLLSSFVLYAQGCFEVPRFPHGAYFRRHFAERLPRVELLSPLHLRDFVFGKKLEISLRSYLELVLANNTEIQIQRLSIEPQLNAITRECAPFDPFVTASFQSTRSTTPSQNALDGATTLSQLRQPLRFTVQKTLESGTQYTIGFDGNKSSSNNSFATFNPALTANFNFGFTQPLLRNRGKYVNRLPILIARSRYEVSRYTFEDQLMRLLQAAENFYWTVIEARENLRVQEKALEFLETSLKRYQKEIELGAIAPVEIYQPQQVYTTQEAVVTQGRYRLQQAEDALRRQIGADLDPTFRDMPLVLTETILPLSDDLMRGREALVEMALQKRPDIRAVHQNEAIDDLNIKQTKNALLPDLSLNATYTSTGRGGQFIERNNVFAGDGSLSEIVRTMPGGMGDALNQLFRLNFPIYAFSLNLRFPIRDHKAAADLADVTVSKRLNVLRARAVEQQIRLEVLNAASEVENSRASVRLAQLSVDFAQKRVDTELKKYDLGDTTIFFLLDAQNSLTRAEAELVSQSVQYRRNLLNLSRVSGTLLEEHAEGLTPLTGTTAGALSPALAPLVSELTQASNKPPVENRPTSPPEMNEAALPKALATPTPENPPPTRTSQPGEPTHGGAPTNTPGADRLYLQVAAGKQPQARALADTLKQQGFSARLSKVPHADLFRVLVGPFANATTLGKAKVDLENAGFRPIVRKWAVSLSP